jgi:hypothetical protein
MGRSASTEAVAGRLPLRLAEEERRDYNRGPLLKIVRWGSAARRGAGRPSAPADCAKRTLRRSTTSRVSRLAGSRCVATRGHGSCIRPWPSIGGRHGFVTALVRQGSSGDAEFVGALEA